MSKKSNYLLKKQARAGRLNELLNWIDEHAIDLLENKSLGLEALGVGKKNASRVDDTDSEWCLVGFVKEKLSKKTIRKKGVSLFSDAALACQSQSTIKPLSESETDIIECGDAFRPMPGLSAPAALRGAFGGAAPAVDLQKRFNALRSGIGITNPEGAYPNSLGVGTLGFFVEDKNDQRYLVSNNHVIAAENAASIGDSIVQPGTLDLTQSELNLMNTSTKLRNQLRIGELSAWVDIDFGQQMNEVDVAIAALTDSRDAAQLSRIGFGSDADRLGKPYTVNANGEINGDARVYKAGRTTGWTEGEVTAIGVVSSINYSTGVAKFKNQLAIAPSADNSGPFSAAGDSGSGIWNTDNELVGLLFAGSPGRTLANPVDLVHSQITKALGKGRLKLVARH